jgi:hypothetical protein
MLGGERNTKRKRDQLNMREGSRKSFTLFGSLLDESQVAREKRKQRNKMTSENQSMKSNQSPYLVHLHQNYEVD